jgi:hypothetical protein
MGIKIGIRNDEFDYEIRSGNFRDFVTNIWHIIDDINPEKIQEYLNAHELVHESKFIFRSEEVRRILETYVNNMYNEETKSNATAILYKMYACLLEQPVVLSEYTKILCKEVCRTKEMVIELDMFKDLVKGIETYSNKLIKLFLIELINELAKTNRNIHEKIFEYVLTYVVGKEKKPYLQGKISLFKNVFRFKENSGFYTIGIYINKKRLGLLIKHDSLNYLLELEELDKKIRETEGKIKTYQEESWLKGAEISEKILKNLIDTASTISSYQKVIDVMFKEDKLKYFDRYLPKKEREYYYENYPEKFI